MRIVLDTASFVTAVRSADGAAGEIVRMVFCKEIVALMDLKLSLEYQAVALRPEHIAASAFDGQEIKRIIRAFAAFSESIEVSVKIRPLSSDPNDDMILDLAFNGHAEAIVTSNVKHFATAGRMLKIPVKTPAEFLQAIRRGDKHAN